MRFQSAANGCPRRDIDDMESGMGRRLYPQAVAKENVPPIFLACDVCAIMHRVAHSVCITGFGSSVLECSKNFKRP